MAAPAAPFSPLNITYHTAVAVTPSDSTLLAQVCNALYIGGAGVAVVLLQDGTTVTLSGIPAGAIIPLRVQRVNATSTTATLIVALY